MELGMRSHCDLKLQRTVDGTIEIHRIEMTSLSQRTAPGGQSRRVPL